MAAGGLAFASLVGSQFGALHLWPSLFVISVFVAAYNLGFHFILRSRWGQDPDFDLRQLGVVEIVVDLLALLVTVHYTGGLTSPALLFFVFHMAIGTTMLSKRSMYSIAGVTYLGLFALYLAEASGLLPRYPIDPTTQECGPICGFNLIAVMVAVFGTVYLTGTVTERSRRNRLQLEEVTTQLRQKTVQLEQVLEEIRDLERRKSHYMRISAHQLRSPLGTIKTTLRVLTDGYVNPRSERGRRLLEGTVARADNLLAIVNDLLELAKIREGQEKAPWTRRVDINGLLAESVEALKPLAQRHDVRLIADLQGRAILRWGVPPDLRYAFDNLLDNAIRYSRPGGDVRVAVASTEDNVTVSIGDQGIGIPQDQQFEVFLEFVRAPNAKRHAPDGTGLGLAIVRAAIDLHSGSVALASREGVGTTVTVSLPLRIAPPPAVSEANVGQA